MIGVLKNFSGIASTRTFKQSLVTFSGTFINGTLGFLFYVYCARYLGPENFGLLIISLTVLALVADIGNFGINSGIVNFVSKYRTSDPKVADKYLKLALELKICFGLITIILGYLLAPNISNLIFNKPSLVVPLQLASIGVATTWLFSFVTSYFQAFEKFISWSVIQIFTNLLRLLFILFCYLQATLDVNLSLVGYIVMPFLGFLIAMSVINKRFIYTPNEKKVFGDFFAFNKWVGISSIASSISSKADTFILGTLLGAKEVGIYAAAYQIVQVIPQLISALGTVIAPKFASFGNKQIMFAYYKKLQVMVGVISLLGLAGIPVFKYLIPILMGNKYNDSFVIFSILLVGLLIFLFATPAHNAIIYYFRYPKLLTYLAFVNLGILIIFGYLATIKFGIIGMAMVTVVLNIINYIIPTIWVKSKT